MEKALKAVNEVVNYYGLHAENRGHIADDEKYVTVFAQSPFIDILITANKSDFSVTIRDRFSYKGIVQTSVELEHYVVVIDLIIRNIEEMHSTTL